MDERKRINADAIRGKGLIEANVLASVLNAGDESAKLITQQLTKPLSTEEIELMLSNQAAIADEIVKGINENLKAQSVVSLQSFTITGFVLDEQVQQAIENKAIALQKQQQAQIDLQTARTIAENNDIISKSLTPTLLQKTAIDKWNGNSAVFNVGGSTNQPPVIINTPNK